MKPHDLLLKAGQHYYIYGAFASTAARRLKDAYQQYHPRLKIAIVQPGSPPSPGNVCTFHVSACSPRSLESRSMDGLIFASDTNNLIFGNANGERHEVELPRATVNALTS